MAVESNGIMNELKDGCLLGVLFILALSELAIVLMVVIVGKTQRGATFW
jgi:hypothetical protein